MSLTASDRDSFLDIMNDSHAEPRILKREKPSKSRYNLPLFMAKLVPLLILNRDDEHLLLNVIYLQIKTTSANVHFPFIEIIQKCCSSFAMLQAKR
ncbi:hypothetical protein T01_1087 [Trichinella spiralis]|uniref:Uncharacterized protein n=1 Tax=Trichinella spiralis TaxID=6334 RepID=A0A0V1BDF9_TRISP|nr:hypothetical protein T01_1087 [Trichinella spiralis]